jgi:uncharacterized protein (TIGR04255 family)
MARQRHLTNAPITEALIDVHVEPKAGLTFEGLKEALGARDFGYYIKSPIAHGLFGFRLTSGGNQAETTSAAEQIGLRMHSADELYVAQCRLSGFTLSRLPPYEEWENLAAEAKRLWTIYTDCLAPLRVTRVATRFINKLQLPLQPGDSYQIYLERLVDVPSGAPQAVASFFQRFELVDVESGHRVILTAAQEPTSPPTPPSVILDVDAFMPTNLRPQDDQLWLILEQLRALKNRTFFSSLTEQAAELYE